MISRRSQNQYETRRRLPAAEGQNFKKNSFKKASMPRMALFVLLIPLFPLQACFSGSDGLPTHDGEDGDIMASDGDLVADGGTETDPEADSPVPALNGELGRIDRVDVLWLWGTPEEMGYAEGALLCGRITRVLEDMYLTPQLSILGYSGTLDLIHQTAAVPPERELQLRAIIEGMKAHCPAGDLQVVSDVLPDGPREITYDDLILINYAGVLLDQLGCSSLTVWGEASATGAMIHARNTDTAGGFDGAKLAEILVKVYRSNDSPAITWASVNLPGRVGCISCFNDQGGGITNHNADRSALDSTDTTGLAPISDISELALQAARGSADAVAAADAIYDAAPRSGGNNLHMFMPCRSDACLGGVVFENDGGATHADGRATVRSPGDVDDDLQTDAAIVCTNHFVKRVENSNASAGSLERYGILIAGINQALESGGLDMPGALSLMAAVSAPGLTHPTLYTTIVDTSSMTLYLHLAATEEDDAPLQSPHVLPLEELFAFPR